MLASEMDDPLYKIVLSGRHGVGKTTIFRDLQHQGDRDMQTVETGTGISVKDREKWTVNMHSRGRKITVRY